MYKRILLKLSGEALGGKRENGPIEAACLDFIAEELTAVASLPDTRLAIVVGGGNIWRGARDGIMIERVTADSMGMLATVINGLALRSALRRKGVDAELMSSVAMEPVAELFTADKAEKYLKAGKTLIFAGGTGSPFFTTDTGASLRAAEIGADIIFKATQVDGVYTDDPKKNPSAEKIEDITYEEAIRRDLKIMDTSAMAMCRENDIKTLVFNLHKKGNIARAASGEKIGTLIHE